MSLSAPFLIYQFSGERLAMTEQRLATSNPTTKACDLRRKGCDLRLPLVDCKFLYPSSFSFPLLSCQPCPKESCRIRHISHTRTRVASCRHGYSALNRRVHVTQVSYGLGIYVLNLLIGFLSPKIDPELEAMDGASLPTKDSDEFKPFIRRLPEFRFWYSITKAFVVSFILTFFSVLDVPVFWPILLCYWIVLFVLTMKRQIIHMIKYKYIPFDIGKQSYASKKRAGGSSSPRD